MSLRSIFTLSLMSMLAACAGSSLVLTGMPRAPIAAAEVRVYTQAPQRFEEIAVLSASRKSVSSAGGERAIARMIASMRNEAAQLGANGLLLEDFSDSTGLGVGTAIGSETYTHNGSISLGVGGSLGVVKKLARARAIVVAP
jgi:xanthine/uracil/vitamin C permease (AzgA family)